MRKPVAALAVAVLFLLLTPRPLLGAHAPGEIPEGDEVYSLNPEGEGEGWWAELREESFLTYREELAADFLTDPQGAYDRVRRMVLEVGGAAQPIRLSVQLPYSMIREGLLLIRLVDGEGEILPYEWVGEERISFLAPSSGVYILAYPENAIRRTEEEQASLWPLLLSGGAFASFSGFLAWSLWKRGVQEEEGQGE